MPCTSSVVLPGVMPLDGTPFAVGPSASAVTVSLDVTSAFSTTVNGITP